MAANLEPGGGRGRNGHHRTELLVTGCWLLVEVDRNGTALVTSNQQRVTARRASNVRHHRERRHPAPAQARREPAQAQEDPSRRAVGRQREAILLLL